MAASSAMQSILARPPLNRVVSNRSTNRVNQLLTPTSYVPHLPRYASSMRVRCMAEEDQQEQPKPVTTSPSPPQPQQTPRPAPKVSTKFSDILAFSGPAPERINGTSIVLSFASLIPLFQGVSVESKSKGLMTSNAEMWNGRFAMLGLVALAFTESPSPKPRLARAGEIEPQAQTRRQAQTEPQAQTSSRRRDRAARSLPRRRARAGKIEPRDHRPKPKPTFVVTNLAAVTDHFSLNLAAVTDLFPSISQSFSL
ncbi:hypothetical protein CMV_017139 [Castanea mollissima]|uniref:Early light-induced protein n=1 Tax=Castanea mollissima TaxID=60419 RepID=A0A8J4QRG2_9ROSI|nr:hypothetical protein CMV_017139 [Castanea mollissima]